MDEILVGKVTIPASLKKIHFPKISDQVPLTQKLQKVTIDIHHLTSLQFGWSAIGSLVTNHHFEDGNDH